MAGRNSATLILEVDARIASAQRALNQLAREVKRDATGMSNSLAQTGVAGERMGKQLSQISRSTRSGFTNLSFQIGDVTQGLAMGTRASTIFAQQSGHVIQALQMMGGEGNKFLRFLGGPWGIALATATVILGTLIPKLFDTGDETKKLTDKMAKQRDEAAAQERANKVWARSIDGVREAQKNLRDELTASFKTEESVRQQNLSLAQRNLGAQEGGLARARKDLGVQQGRRGQLIESLKSPTVAASPEFQQQIEGQIAGLDKKIAATKQKIAQLQADIEASQKTLVTAQLVLGNASADASSSATTAIQSYTNTLQGAVNVAAQAGKITVDAAVKARIAINAYVEAQQKAAGEGVNFSKVGASSEITKLTKAFAAGRLDAASYTKAVENAAAALTKAAKAAADAKKAGSGALTTFINPVEGPIKGRFGEQRGNRQHQGIDIAVPVGTPVKAPAGGKIIEAGTLPGYGNVVFIDHGGGTITRLAHLSKIGVTDNQLIEQGQVIGLSGGARGAPGSGNSRGPHVHQETIVGGRAVDPRKGRFRTDEAAAAVSAERAAESAEVEAARLAKEALDRTQRFQNESEKLDSAILQAKGQLVVGYEGQADAAIAGLQQAQLDYERDLDRAVADKQLNAADAELLKRKHATLTFEQAKAVEQNRMLARMQRQNELEQRQFEYKLDDLRFLDEEAKTQAERRRIQLDILDVTYQQKQAALEALKAQRLLAKDRQGAADAQASLDQLPIEKARDTSRTLRGTMNPLEAWADSIPQTAEEIIEAMQSIEARGLDSLANAITDVIMGTASLQEAFTSMARAIIADIIQMTIRMLIFKAISGMIGGASAGSAGADLPGGGSSLYGDAFIGSAKGNVFNGGDLIPFRTGGVISRSTVFPIRGGKTGLMGEAGPEAIMPLTRDTQGRLAVRAMQGAAANSNAPIEIIVHTAPSKDAWAKVEVLAGEQVARAAPVIVRTAVNHTMKTANRPVLMGRK